ncbi:MAG: XRE family transcriptional regulator [Erysipelotrichaceae bacterium]|nr:XRE family transcriptional regulator [Erysipelotrichaceae bacterium]
MYFKSNLRYLRKKNNLSQNDLANYLGYKNFTTIQKWEDGTSLPKMNKLIELARYFNIDVDSLLNSDIVNDTHLKIPILGDVKAGFDAYAQNSYDEFEIVSSHEVNNGEYFYLRIIGDSMINAHIFENDLVLFRKQYHLEDNEIGLFQINEDEFTIKRIKYEKGGIVLIADNDDVDNRYFENADQLKIIAKAIHVKTKL